MGHTAVHPGPPSLTPSPAGAAPRRRRRPPPLSVPRRPPASLPTSFYPPPGGEAPDAPATASSSYAVGFSCRGTRRRTNEDRVVWKTPNDGPCTLLPSSEHQRQGLHPSSAKMSKTSCVSESSATPTKPWHGTTPSQQLRGVESALYAVFDGHGGECASEYAAAQIPLEVMSGSASGTMPSRLSAAFQNVDARYCASADPMDVKGTTATVAVVTQSDAPSNEGCRTQRRRRSPMLHVANVGDSRAMLLCQGFGDVDASFLTTDHSATRADEIARVEAAGGFVVNDRVNGILAVTRAIGDVSLKGAVVSTPEIVSVPLTPHTRFLVLATDGLWDFVCEADVISVLVREDDPGWTRRNMHVASQALAELAVSRGSTDDISVLVVDLSAHMRAWS